MANAAYSCALQDNWNVAIVIVDGGGVTAPQDGIIAKAGLGAL